MKAMLIMMFVAGCIYATENQTCIEKLDELKMLKEQNLTGAEKVVYGILNQEILVGYSKDRDKEIDEKIRVLELELRECKQNVY